MEPTSIQEYQLHNARHYILKALTLQPRKQSLRFRVDQILSLSLFDKLYVENILRKSVFFLHDHGETYQFFQKKFSKKSTLSWLEQCFYQLTGKHQSILIPGLNFLKEVRLIDISSSCVTAYEFTDGIDDYWSAFNQLLDFLTIIVFMGAVDIQDFPAVTESPQQELLFTGVLPAHLIEWWRQ